jgi:hypothetical protein
MKLKTLNSILGQVNSNLKAIKGDGGYYYFYYNDGKEWDTQYTLAKRITDYSIEKWQAEAREFLNK